MTDLTVLVDQVAERHYLERCKQLTDPQPAWDDVDPMVRYRLREWVLPTVNATVDLMVEAMKEAVAEERAKVVVYLQRESADSIANWEDGEDIDGQARGVALDIAWQDIQRGAHDGGE